MVDYQRSMEMFQWEVACWRYNRLISEEATQVLTMIKGKLFRSHSWVIFQVSIFGDLITFAINIPIEMTYFGGRAYFPGDMSRDETMYRKFVKFHGPRCRSEDHYKCRLVPNTFLDCVSVIDFEYREETLAVHFGTNVATLTFVPVQLTGVEPIKHLDENKMNLDANIFSERVSEIRRMYNDMLSRVFTKEPFVPLVVVHLMIDYLVITGKN